MAGPLTIAAYSLDLPCYACAQLRLLGPARVLADQVRLRWAARSDGRDYAISAQAMDGADLIVFTRHFPGQATWPLVEQALRSGVPVVYDTDDDFLAVPDDHPLHARLAPVAPFARRLSRRAFAVTVSTPELARAFAGLARRVTVLPNLLDRALWPGPPLRPEGPVHFVFAGTPSHAADLAALGPVLDEVRDRLRNGARFTAVGCPAPRPWMEERPFLNDYAAYARLMAELRPDIGLAPLSDTPFNRCKSAVKWLEYAALGAVGVFADLPPYAPVEHGVTGFTVGPDPRAWIEVATRLARDAPLRRDMALRANREVLARHDLQTGAGRILAAWRAIRREWDHRG